MGKFTDTFNKGAAAADAAYQGLLPKSAWEYAKAGFWAAGRLARDLLIDGIFAVPVVIKSVVVGIPAMLKSVGHTLKGLGAGLKAAYHRYQQDQAATDAASQEAWSDFSNAGGQFVEAVSTSAGVAYQGMKPILSDAASSIVHNGGEAILDAAKVATIGVVEGIVKPVKNSSVARQLGETTSQLETLVEEQAHRIYDALPSGYSFLPGFAFNKAAQGRGSVRPEGMAMVARGAAMVAVG